MALGMETRRRKSNGLEALAFAPMVIPDIVLAVALLTFFSRLGLAMGLHISFAGMLTYKNAHELRAVAAKAPLDRVLIETDCPYLAPVPVRGKRNEPANVVHTACVLAQTLGVTLDVIAEHTTRNGRQLFGI